MRPDPVHVPLLVQPQPPQPPELLHRPKTGRRRLWHGPALLHRAAPAPPVVTTATFELIILRQQLHLISGG